MKATAKITKRTPGFRLKSVILPVPLIERAEIARCGKPGILNWAAYIRGLVEVDIAASPDARCAP